MSYDSLGEFGPEQPPESDITPETRYELQQNVAAATERYSEVRRSYYKDSREPDQRQQRIDLTIKTFPRGRYLLIMREPETFGFARRTLIEVGDDGIWMSEQITADTEVGPEPPVETRLETDFTPVADKEARARRWLDYFEQGYDWHVERHEAEPAKAKTREALVGEAFGLLSTADHVALTHGEADIDVYKDPDETIIVSEDKLNGRYVRETVVSIMGSGSAAELTAREIITIKDSDLPILPVRQAQSINVAQQIGIYRQELNAGLASWILKLLRTAEERLRQEPGFWDDIDDLG